MQALVFIHTGIQYTHKLEAIAYMQKTCKNKKKTDLKLWEKKASKDAVGFILCWAYTAGRGANPKEWFVFPGRLPRRKPIFHL